MDSLSLRGTLALKNKITMLKELFEQNMNIVINTDIDGFLCGMILQKYYGCRIVGFSDSRDTVWLIPEISDIDSPIYIDLYVARPNVICIEQHIIAFNSEHHNTIKSFGTKINPNLDRCRTFVGDMGSDYYHKYPFGTVHYVIALMAREGINVDLPDLSKNINIKATNVSTSVSTTNAGQVILRADDALYSTLSPYRENALDWWDWLDPAHKYPAIESIRQFISSCEISRAKEYKDNVGRFFRMLGCDGNDGAFKKVTDEDGNLLMKVKNYRDIVCNIVGMSLCLPEKYVIHKGQYAVQFSKPEYDMNVLNASNLYSYAFIYGPHPRFPNFSFTIDMQ